VRSRSWLPVISQGDRGLNNLHKPQRHWQNCSLKLQPTPYCGEYLPICLRFSGGRRKAGQSVTTGVGHRSSFRPTVPPVAGRERSCFRRIVGILIHREGDSAGCFAPKSGMLTTGLVATIHKQPTSPFSSPVMISQAVTPDDIWPGFSFQTAQLHLDLGDSGHGDSPAKVAHADFLSSHCIRLTGEGKRTTTGLANLTSHQVQVNDASHLGSSFT